MLGFTHRTTLVLEAKAARITLARTNDDGPLREVVRRMEATLGAQHPQTAQYAALL